MVFEIRFSHIWFFFLGAGVCALGFGLFHHFEGNWAGTFVGLFPVVLTLFAAILETSK